MCGVRFAGLAVAPHQRLTTGALIAADSILSPILPAALALPTADRLLRALAELREGLKPDVRLLGVLPVAVDHRQNLTEDTLQLLSDRLGGDLMETRIRVNVRLAEAPAHRKPIYQYDPRSNGAADYRVLTEEVMSR